MQNLAKLLGCQPASLPASYLGLPLGGKRKVKSFWDPVVKGIYQRLAGWRGNYLSKGGTLTLIKSVLSNLPVYLMSLFRAPLSVLQKIDKARRDFFWSSMDGPKSITWWNGIDPAALLTKVVLA